MRLHTLDCTQQGHYQVLNRSVETDVVVLAVSTFPSLHLDELSIAFGMKKTYGLLPIHILKTNLVSKESKHCHSSMHSRAVALSPHSAALERRQHGTLGLCTQKLQRSEHLPESVAKSQDLGRGLLVSEARTSVSQRRTDPSLKAVRVLSLRH